MKRIFLPIICGILALGGMASCGGNKCPDQIEHLVKELKEGKSTDYNALTDVLNQGAQFYTDLLAEKESTKGDKAARKAFKEKKKSPQCKGLRKAYRHACDRAEKILIDPNTKNITEEQYGLLKLAIDNYQKAYKLYEGNDSSDE